MCPRTTIQTFLYKKCIFYTLMALLFTFIVQVQGHRLEFTIEPEDVVVYPDNSAVLNCRAQLIDGDLSQPISTEHISWRRDFGQILTPIEYNGELYRSQLKNGSLYFSTVVHHQDLTGPYRCVASIENVGSIVSRSATVRIASLSGFEQEPKDNILFPGQTAYLTCLVNADPLATIQWLKDERPFTLDESRMLILPSGALEIDDVQTSDLGTYRCNASNQFNQYRLSNKALLSFNDDLGLGAIMSGPKFIARPRSMVVTEGDTITLDCVAVGNPKPWVTWLKNGVTIDMAHLDSRFRKIGTGSLQITNVEESDAGSYQCRAITTEDTDDSTAILDVQVPPRFIKKPHDIREVAKKDIEFECEIYGKPDPIVQWLKNGEIIKHNAYLQLVNGYNLKILGLMQVDAGIFQCIGSNPAGNIQASAVLTIIDQNQRTQTQATTKAKTVTRFPRNKLSRTHAHNYFSLLKSSDLESNDKKVSSGPGSMPSADDYFDDQIESSKSSSIGTANFAFANKDFEMNRNNDKKRNLKFDPANILTMLKSDKGDADNTNTNGNDNDDRLGQTHFAFTDNPPFLPSLSPQHTGESSVLTDADRERGLPSEPRNLTAVIVRQRFVTLSWKPPEVTNGEIISYSVGFQQEGSKRERMQLTKKPRLEEINISGLNPDKKYYFRVTAFTQKGAGKPSEYLEVITKSEEHVPSAPLNMKAYATSSTSIYVSWDEPEITNGIIQRYKVYYMEGNMEHHKDTVVGTITEMTLTELSVYTNYSIWIVALNQNGAGTATNELTIQTLSAHPTAPPSNVTAEVTSSSSVIIRWEPPPIEFQNGVLTGYKIRYKKSGGRVVGAGAGGKTFVTDQNVRSITLNSLDKASIYQVKVQACNINGTGPWSDWVTIETYENDLDETSVPGEPGPLKFRSMQKSILVMWNPPKNSNIVVRGYTLGWGKGVPDIYMDSLDGKARYYEIKDLEPDSEYVISLRAKNDVGDGRPVYTVAKTKLENDELLIDAPPSSALDISSSSSLPALFPPVGLKAIVLTSNTVVLYWIDTTLSKSQYVTDNRYYQVKYTSILNRKDRYFNATDLNCMIDDLRPNTQYEFTVKVVKGRRESDWSMVVTNTTFEAAPTSYPRDLEVMPFDNNPHMVILKWQPPKQSNGQITGYLIQYTTDKNNKERDWIAEGVIGDKHQTIIQNLEATMTYYFKIQARNSKGYGPFSQIVSFTTGISNGMHSMHENHGFNIHDSTTNPLTNPITLYLIVGGSILIVTIIAVILVVICCKRTNDPNMTPDRNKKGYPKVQKNQNIKPPDLWIHHDQMELKAMEKSSHVSGGGGGTTTISNDGASSSGATTLPRSIGDYDTTHHHHHLHHTLDTTSSSAAACQHHTSNSLDKRSYVPSYMGGNNGSNYNCKQDESNRRVVKPKPIMLPVDSKPPKEPIATATPINNPVASSVHHLPGAGAPSDSPTIASTIVTPAGLITTNRPAYPRTQYTISRAHVTIDQNAMVENPYAIQPGAGASNAYDTAALALVSNSSNYASLPQQQQQQLTTSSAAAQNTGNTSTVNVGGATNSTTSIKGGTTTQGTQGGGTTQGHPLKSFSVPAPPPNSAPGTPAHQSRQNSQVNVRPITSSPYKKGNNTSTHLARSNPSSSGVCDETRPLYQQQQHDNNNMCLQDRSDNNLIINEGTHLLLTNSTSTEELNQEMANLEGLMKDLNAITASEFEC